MKLFLLPLILAASITAQASIIRSAEVGLWVVVPNAQGSADLWHYSYVSGAFEVTNLGRDFNGWGNLPSEPVTTTMVVGNSQNGHNPEDPPVSKFVTEWDAKDGTHPKVETIVQGGASPQNHSAALKQHEKDVAERLKLHPPVVKNSG